jgi:hypothetical protein
LERQHRSNDSPHEWTDADKEEFKRLMLSERSGHRLSRDYRKRIYEYTLI